MPKARARIVALASISTMTMTMMMEIAALAACVAVLPGCYGHATFPAATIAAQVAAPGAPGAARPLRAPRSLPDGTRFGPRTRLRARRPDGRVSPWFTAGTLAATPAGLVTRQRYPLAAATRAFIAGAGPDAEPLLAAVAPPGAAVEAADSGVVVTTNTEGLLVPWLAAYAARAVALGQPPGGFAFAAPGAAGWSSTPIAGERFAALPPASFARLELAPGFAWDDAAAIELRNFNPGLSTAAAAGGAVGGALVVVGSVLLLNPSPAIAAVHAANENTRAEDERDRIDAAPPAALVAASARDPAVLLVSPAGAEATPLFTRAASRRDIIKLVGSADAGVDGSGRFAGGAGLGFRLHDFVELTARLRSQAFAPDGGPAARLLLGGARLALHIDGDGDPRTAFVVGGELSGSLQGGQAFAASLLAGPRFGIGHKLFASALFIPSWIARAGAGSEAQVLFAMEIGFGI